jgi:hypothetical protein
MLKTIEGVVDEQNNIRLLEDVALKPAQRVLVTILDSASIVDLVLSQIQSASFQSAGLAEFDRLQSRMLEIRDDEDLTEEDIQEEVTAYRREKKAHNESGS